MTDEHYEYLSGYIRDLAERMRLKDWRITLSREPVDDQSNYAQSQLKNAALESTIYLGNKFFDGTADDRRETIVHELLHCHLYRSDRAVDAFEKQVAPAVWETVFQVYRETGEVAIEALAWVISPFMPPCELPAA